MISRTVRQHPAFSLPVEVPEQELVFHRDQMGRYNRWDPEVWALADLDLQAPKGSDHGPVLVLPASRVPVSGWAAIRDAQAKGQDTLEVLVGDKLNLRWYPFSRQERLNGELLTFLKSRRPGSMGTADTQFMDKLKEWVAHPQVDFNAVDATGKSALDLAGGLFPATGGRAAALIIAWVIEAGALPNRLSRKPGDEDRVGHTLAQQLLARFHVSAELQDPQFALPESLVSVLKMREFDWSLPHNTSALKHFFARERPHVGRLEGAESLYALWRASELESTLPLSPSPSRSKPRF